MSLWTAAQYQPEDHAREEWREQAIEAMEDDLVAYDVDGRVFGTSGAGASFLARYLIDQGWVSRS